MYYSLNAWQIRNNYLHKEKEQAEYFEERKELKQQVTEWYAKQAEEIFEPEDAQYFNTSQLEKMNESNGRMRKWCTGIQAIYNFNKYQKQRTHGQDTRFLQAPSGNQKTNNQQQQKNISFQIIRPGRQYRISVDSFTF